MVRDIASEVADRRLYVCCLTICCVIESIYSNSCVEVANYVIVGVFAACSYRFVAHSQAQRAFPSLCCFSPNIQMVQDLVASSR